MSLTIWDIPKENFRNDRFVPCGDGWYDLVFDTAIEESMEAYTERKLGISKPIKFHGSMQNPN